MINTNYRNLVVSLRKGLLKIFFNKPEKKNALDFQMYTDVASLLKQSAHDPAVRVAAFSGVGDYFTSGNDLTNFIINSQDNDADLNMDEVLEKGMFRFQEFVAAFIDYPKPLVAVVNGPAIGIGVTILPHFDMVVASSLVTFYCPFVKGSLSPEGCSSFLFPLLMGSAKASDILLFGKKISAQEAFERNLISEVVDHSLLPHVWEKIEKICTLPENSLLNAKSIVKQRLRPYLHKVNEEECEALLSQFKSAEFLDAVMTLLTKKSKL